MEGADSPDEMKRALDALGPEPGDNEAVFLGEDGGRVLPEFSLNVAQENTPINVPYKERNEAKALGAKWDRTEQTWFVPKAYLLINLQNGAVSQLQLQKKYAGCICERRNAGSG
nr:DUF5710 domain-containing protein [Salmonella enterica]WCS70339.1 DNA primase [Salmonella enterica subsp. enterica serovar Rissen]